MDNRKTSRVRTSTIVSAITCLAILAGVILSRQSLPRSAGRTISVNASARQSPDRQAQVNRIGSAATSSLEKRPSRVANAVAKANDPLTAIVGLALRSGISYDKAALARRFAQVLADAPLPERQTAARLLQFALDGQLAELRTLERPDVEALADYLAKQVPGTEIANALEHYLGVPRQIILTAKDPVESLMSLYDSVTGMAPVPDLGAPLVITDDCTTDARVIGHTHVLPAGVQRVYAVFENAGTLRGLDNVWAVWRMPTDDSLVFAKSEQLHPDAPYNYIWLQVNDGWPAGAYQVELYDPRNNTVALAKRQFDIQ